MTRLLAGLSALIVLGLAGPGVAVADVSVNTPNDETTPADGTCSLREAILMANGTAEPDCLGAPTTIIVPAGTYTLSMGELSVSPASPLTISGAGASSTTIDANFNGRAFNIASGTVTISGLTIKDGRGGPQLQGNTATSCPGGLTTLAVGGGILDQGTLTLTGDAFDNNMSAGNGGAVEDAGGALSIATSTFSANNACQTGVSAPTSLGDGGAVDDSTGASATVDSSTVSGNAAQGDGGGLSESSDGGGTVTVTNSTVSDNQAGDGGGGLAGEGGGTISLFADLIADNTAQGSGGGVGGNDSDSVVNSTVFNNTAAQGDGGGIENAGRPVTISFSTINANAAPTGSGGNLANDDSGSFLLDDSIVTGGMGTSGTPDNCQGVGGDFTSHGYNLFDDSGTSCANNPGPAGTDLVNTNPLLGSLADNGGPTNTEALLSGSPANDAANPDMTTCSTETENGSGNPVDQRGFPRPDGSETRCDIGAFEVQDVSLSTTVFDASTNSAWAGTETTGASAFDTSSLAGTVNGFPASGAVTYSRFNNGGCSGSPAATDTETLNPDGSVPHSASTAALAPGSYSYQASYQGNGNDEYPPASGPCELFTVGQRAPTVSTTVFDSGSSAPWSGSESTGASALDGATLGGTATGFPASGTVTYSLFDNGGCSGSPAATDTQTLRADGSVPHSASTGALAPGAYSYQAGYSGDSNYAAATGPCESFAVTKATASVSTTVVDAATQAAWSGNETTGASAFDTTTLGGTATGFPASGTVTYSLFDNGGCSGSPAATDTQTLRADGSVPHSAPTAALAPGSYTYQAGYSGDSNYIATTGPCEPFSVAKAVPSVATTVFNAATNSAWSGGQAGASTYDTASLAATANGFTPSGSVAYSFFGNGSCSGNPASTDSQVVNPDGTVPPSSTSGPLSVGSYSYQASYSGDSSYTGAVGQCEPFTVGPNPDLALSASVKKDSIIAGDQDTVTDTITSSGGSDATGVQFADPAAGFSIKSAHPSQGTCGHTKTTVSCQLGTLAPGQSATVRMVLTAHSAGTITLNSSVSMSQPDPTPVDNSARALITVRAPADLSLVASAQTSQIMVDESDTVNDTVTNVGGSDATEVEFSDPAAGFAIESAMPSQGSCTHDTTTVSCHLGTISPGRDVKLKLVVRGLTPGSFTLRSAVTMATTDPTPADNRQAVSIGVSATPPPPPPPHPKGPPFINLVRLGPICRSEQSKIRLAAHARAGAGIQSVKIRLAHHTIYVYRSQPLAPTHKTVVAWVHGSALATGRTYPVGATVVDVLGRTAHATGSFTVCKPPSKRGFTG